MRPALLQWDRATLLTRMLHCVPGRDPTPVACHNILLDACLVVQRFNNPSIPTHTMD